MNGSSPSHEHGSSSSGMLAGVALGLCTCLHLFSTVANELMSSQSCSSTAAIWCTFYYNSGSGCWQQQRFDFHSLLTNAPKGFLCYRAGQEDSGQLAHAGLLVAAHGGVDLRANSQGTGFVVTVRAENFGEKVTYPRISPESRNLKPKP